MNADFSQFNNEDEVRAENDFLKMKLMLEQGAQFGSIGDAKIPPEIEHAFLQSIIDFEKQCSNNSFIKVFDKINRPLHFKPVSQIQEKEFPSAWSELSGYLLQYGISLEACSPTISAKELYRFTMEELFQEEVEDISIPGLTQCFIYDSYYPDPVFENTRIAKEECIEFILGNHPMQWTHNFKKENLQLNSHSAISIDQFVKITNRFKEAYDKLELGELIDTICIVNEKESWVTGTYTVIASLDNESYTLTGKWKVVFEKDDYLGYWYINTVIIEGIHF